jgi:hypothetical protein
MKRFIFLIFVVLVGFYAVWPAFTGYRIYQGLESNDPGLLAAKIDFPSVRQSMRGPVLDQVNSRIESVMKDLGPMTKLVGEQIPRDNIEKIIDGALATVVEPRKIAEIYAKGGSLNAEIKDAVLNEIDKMGGLAAVLKLDKFFKQGPDNGAAGEKDESISIGGFKVPGALGGLLKNKEVKEALGGFVGKLSLDPEKLAGKLFPSRRDESAVASGGGGKRSFGVGNIKSFGFAGLTAMQVGVARSSDAVEPEVTTEMAFRNYDWRITKMTPNLLER